MNHDRRTTSLTIVLTLECIYKVLITSPPRFVGSGISWGAQRLIPSGTDLDCLKKCKKLRFVHPGRETVFLKGCHIFCYLMLLLMGQWDRQKRIMQVKHAIPKNFFEMRSNWQNLTLLDHVFKTVYVLD